MRRLGALVILALLAPPTSAFAAFPGANGRIVFADSREEANGDVTARVRTVRPDGHGLRTLLESTGPAPSGPNPALPRWSPDGRRLVLSYRLELITMNASGRDRRVVVPAADAADATWAPDGRLLLPVPNGLDVLRADGSRRRTLVGGLPGRPSSPAWAPRGGHVAFEIYSSGAPTLWTARTSGAGAHAPIADGARPAYSPDGRTLAFARRDRVWTMPAAGGRVHAVTRTAPGEVVLAVVFSPDGRRLLFQRRRQSPDIGPSELFLVRRSGGRERRLALGGSAGSPDWQPLPRGR
jgi:Tol biopolymer transport system component